MSRGRRRRAPARTAAAAASKSQSVVAGDQTHPRLRHRQVAAVVRQRAGRGDLAVAAGRLAQPLEPPGGDDAVGVEDDDVGGRRAGERAIDVRWEADIALAAQVEQAVVALGRVGVGFGGALRQPGDPLAGARVRAGVIADEDRHLARRVREHAAQTFGEVLVSPVDGDADDDARHAPRRDARWRRSTGRSRADYAVGALLACCA